MKTKSLFWLIAMLLCVNVANAQKKSKSISISISPYGIAQSSIKTDGVKNKFDYKNVIGGSVAYESQRDGLSWLTELSFESAKFDKSKIPAPTTAFDVTKSDNFMHLGLTEYIGFTINKNKRIQFPIYLGIGGGYIKGGPIHNFTFDAAAKFRVKFYITNKIGVFAGVSGRYSIGSKKNQNETNGDKKNLHVDNWLGTADAGVIFSF